MRFPECNCLTKTYKYTDFLALENMVFQSGRKYVYLGFCTSEVALYQVQSIKDGAL